MLVKKPMEDSRNQMLVYYGIIIIVLIYFMKLWKRILKRYFCPQEIISIPELPEELDPVPPPCTCENESRRRKKPHQRNHRSPTAEQWVPKRNSRYNREY